MPYKLKLFKTEMQKKINMIWQYGKACSFYFGKCEKNFLFVILSIFRAHFKYKIIPLLYSYYQLENVSESEWGEYIVDQKKFNEMLAGDSPVEARREIGNKLRFYQYCIINNLPIVPVYCVVSGDLELIVDGVEIIRDLNRWREILSTMSTELFIKPILGASGIGSFAVYKENGIFRFKGRSGLAEELYVYLQKKIKPGQGFIVQPRMRTHSSLKGIVSDQGLSTIRVATIRCNGKSKIIMACLKIVRGENEHDNFSKGMSNNLIVPINLNTGELNKAWGSLRSDWPQMVQYAIHPDTGNQIEGILLPFWREIFELALRAQESVPLLQTIGWDIALTDEGVFIVEANTAYDAATFQLFERRGFKSEFEKLFNS